MLDPIINALMCACVLQIRQEKPYYIADPEVDSLVSISLFYSSVSKMSVASFDIIHLLHIMSFRWRVSESSDASNHSVSLLGDHCKSHANLNARIAKHASFVSLRHRQLIMGAIKEEDASSERIARPRYPI